MMNRLADATSPYLLQHRSNPVDWYPWGREAFAAARSRDVPILLSVGYAACHWCHVMAHESFEDEPTAAFMNEHFVNVKVDREERPDIDRIYMDAVQAMTGRGGWPMTVFLDHDGRPFYAGTYFPKDDRPGYPSFMRLLATLADAWKNRRDEIDHNALQLVAAVQRTIEPSDDLIGSATVEAALTTIGDSFDGEHGGIGRAPKFPQAPVLELLLRTAATGQPSAAEMLAFTLERMAAGGIYDQIGGGFARYSVDRVWLVPHFEKMLYDNALLARIYLRAAQVLERPEFTRIARETLRYLDRDLGLDGGGFASAEDADSEGVEGKFYVWDIDEFTDVAGADAAVAADVFGVEPGGNFEGMSILYHPLDFDEVAARHGITVGDVRSVVDRVTPRLLARRTARVRPALDDKVVAAWNGLAIRAFAEAAVVLDDDSYRARAVAAARFVRDELVDGDRLMRSWRNGATSGPGFCDDYAACAVGFYELFRATGDGEWFDLADRLTDAMVERFGDPAGGFFTNAGDAEQLIARPKDLMDNPVPSGNSLAIEALLNQQAYTGRNRQTVITGAFRALGGLSEAFPTAVAYAIALRHSMLVGIREVAVVGDPQDETRLAMERVLAAGFRPHCISISAVASETPIVPLLAGRSAPGGSAAYVCRDFVCEAPVTTAADLRRLVDESTG